MFVYYREKVTTNTANNWKRIFLPLNEGGAGGVTNWGSSVPADTIDDGADRTAAGDPTTIAVAAALVFPLLATDLLRPANLLPPPPTAALEATGAIAGKE